MKSMGFAMVAIALSAWTLTPGDAFAQQSLGPTLEGTTGGSVTLTQRGQNFSGRAQSSDFERAEERASEIGRRYGQNIPSSQASLSGHDTVLLMGLGVEGRLEDGEVLPGSFTVTRFGLDENGQLVAHGVVTPTPMTSSMALVVRDPSIDIGRLSLHERALLLSSPLEPSEYDYTPEELGLSSRVETESGLEVDTEIRGLVGDGSGMPMDEHDVDMTMMQGGWGGWTGISAGYGESGVGASVPTDSLGREISGLSDDETLFTTPSLGLAWRSEADVYIPSPFALNLETGELDEDELMYFEDEYGDEVMLSDEVLLSPYALQYATAPVTIVSASCDQLTLGFGDMMVAGTSMSFDEGMVTIMAEPGNERLNSTLCAIADGSELTGEQVDVLIDPLNGLIMTTE